jgi:hypothetical protein
METPPELLDPTSTPLPPSSSDERWTIRIELPESDVAKLYGQRLARGALVWKRGMREWRPLLSVPELTGLLRRTRLAVAELARPGSADPITVPRNAVPVALPDIVPSHEDSGRRIPITVSPTAIDIAPPAPSSPRRHYEAVAAAVAGFALAWFLHAGQTPDLAMPPPVAAAAPQQAAASPPAAPVVTAASTIPLVSLSDLPVVGATSSTTNPVRTSGDRAPQRARSHGDGPSRSDLQAALSRVTGAASGCGERNGPVRVVITFAGSGVARSIRVSGTGLPSSTRSCIIGAASRARVPAFTGDPVTVGKTL